MEQEFVIFSIVRLALLLFSFFALPPGMLIVKSAWHTNDLKKMRKGIALLWGAILAGCMFIKMFG